LDITSELGIPCYKAFIQGPEGQILKGTAAHLDGKRAALSALMEVPYHPAWLGPVTSSPCLRERAFASLPDYSSGGAHQDLKALERVLTTNGYHPLYVDLTREDLQIPVVRALVPGLEISSDFDQFSRPSLRQFGHYLFGL
jgi:ribosomal protein S12 methylthiotransferase accessory factor YcaO